MRNTVFVSYCHKDQKWLEEFMVHFKVFEREMQVNLWVDQQIETGARWLNDIETALSSARAAVLLVTANYLASDFVVNKEIPAILQHQKHGLAFAWVAVSASTYHRTPLDEFQAANNPHKPLDTMSHARRQQQWIEIVKKVHDLCLDGGPAATPVVTATPVVAGYESELDGGSGRNTRLGLELDTSNERVPPGGVISQPNALYSRGWIENPQARIDQQENSRVSAFFVRALITNPAPRPARNVTLCLDRVEDPHGKCIIATGQLLRWSDEWEFRADAQRGTVYADGGFTALPSLSKDVPRHCDVCFHYDLDGPPQLGRLKSRVLYFAVRNLPSDTYSLSMASMRSASN